MAKAQKFETITITDQSEYPYETVRNDKNGVRIYTLKNGLKVYLAKNDDAPRIQTYIPVRTGSNNDPSDNTGLAHYLEHMMFKGTSKLGSANWEKEKPLLDQIAQLYEEHKAEVDPEKKKMIYKKIDEISQEASKFAIANEYDKAISSLGATGTNAHTWLDETVYKNNIPSNELEKWLQIEKERFSELTLRLFHTELESVYEEFNRAQDNDARLVNYELMDALFPKHPNGQQTTLGKGEHLKNPSMVAIHKYFDTFYVPNNYALILVGDLDFDQTIKLVDEYFGKLPYKKLPEKLTISEEPMTKIVERTVKSPTAPRLQMAWRSSSYGTREERIANLVANILCNSGESGLIDLNINHKQVALHAVAYNSPFKTYGNFSLVIIPKNGQSLEEAKELLLEQIDLVKKGAFPDWLIPAIVTDFKIQRMKDFETANGLATALYNNFIAGQSWEEELNEINEYEKITKAEVVKFANDFFKDNYVVVRKEKGTNDKLVRVENPGITPVKINREDQSQFLKQILAEKTADLQPVFIDYSKEIEIDSVLKKKVSFVENKYNDLAQVYFIFPFGSDHDKELGLATQVLQYLGTGQLSAEELKQEFFKLGITNDFKTGPDQLTISLAGLEENMAKGIELLRNWMHDAKPDQKVYMKYVDTILESREVAKKDKQRIMNALSNFAKFGKDSRMTDVVSKERLQSIQSQEMTQKIQSLLKMDYQIFFYGKDFAGFKNYVKPFIQAETLKTPERKIYPEPETSGKVFFTNYDMVQTEMAKTGKASNVDLKDFGKINVFNEYFGRGLSSIVFQEIRESKSLAYSAYVSYVANPELNHPDYVTTYIGTQANKLAEAVNAMDDLMAEFPQIPAQFENAKNAVLKQIASSRITRTNIFFNQLNLKKLGVDYDIRKNMYSEIQKLTLADLTNFYYKKIKPLTYNTAIIGKRENLDQNAMSQMGMVYEMTLEDIFGY
ncbi:M16 family metallopeptidase [Chryseobacterium koreense]|uniref:Peptidase M16 n=1 Tax=Chryseobacterium koreense CCUG 49689 TaxID=1304281 RepID=A0A0J7IWD6_9FLAO|nr:M16 family metallopeptidase [Chryseobacterium koreense]KMQ70613.1 peptidase M16 [Chryseobacterium koreense CCUG 49689]MBB5334592.1 putative Zn-dependent peptidase [Chryseobacterium koreense]